MSVSDIFPSAIVSQYNARNRTSVLRTGSVTIIWLTQLISVYSVIRCKPTAILFYHNSVSSQWVHTMKSAIQSGCLKLKDMAWHMSHCITPRGWHTATTSHPLGHTCPEILVSSDSRICSSISRLRGFDRYPWVPLHIAGQLFHTQHGRAQRGPTDQVLLLSARVIVGMRLLEGGLRAQLVGAFVFWGWGGSEIDDT